MFKLKLILLLMITFLSGHSLFAQMDFAEADSSTYQQYLDHHWKPLIKTGRKAVKAGLDYYYLNMRIGIAYYNKLQYYKARTYFEKALKNDAGSDDAKEYLFWSELLSGDEKAADDTYLSIPDSAQSKIKYKIKRPFESIYVEGGIKISTNTQIANHLGYAQLGLNHKFTSAFSIYHAYTFQTQKQVWGHYMQHQYYFAPTVKFKKHLELQFGFHYSHYNGTLDFTDHFQDHSPPPVNPGPAGKFRDIIGYHNVRKTGKYIEDLFLSQLSVSKTIKGFTITPHAGLILTFEKPSLIDAHRDSLVIAYHTGPIIDSTRDSLSGGTISHTSATRYQAMIGVGLQYDFGRITLGVDVTGIFSSTVKTAVVTPWIKALLCKKVGLSASYMYKGAYPLALFDGSQLYNSLDKIKYKASITGEFYATKKITLYLTYQFEGITDNFSSQDYKLHTLLIGLNFKL